MALSNYSDYKERLAKIQARRAKKDDKAEEEYKACMKACDSKFGHVPHLDLIALWGCEGDCEQEKANRRAAAHEEEHEDTTSLEVAAVGAGIIRKPLIVCAKRFEGLATSVYKVGDFAAADIITVETSSQLRAVLAPDRYTQMLRLVMDAELGELSLDGELISLGELAQGAHMTVGDFVVLNGTSDGIQPEPADQNKLKAALHTGLVKVDWTAVPRPVITVAVASEDKRTHKLPSAVASGTEHFVTVMGSGEVRLEASVDPNDPENTQALKWTASGGTIKANGLKAKISRTTPQRVDVELSSRFGSTKTIVVWVVWAELKPLLSGKSPIALKKLGNRSRRDSVASERFYRAAALVDWIATIMPDSVITDTDRPAIERQKMALAPGETVPTPKEYFSGWEVAGQKRTKTEQGITLGGHDTHKTIDVTKWDPLSGGDQITEITTSPYRSDDGPFGADVKWEDFLLDTDGQNCSYLRKKTHGRVFVRVQLGDEWYQCSEEYVSRWHYNARRPRGKWGKDPKRPDILDLTNNDF
jgi:hypothetical protein